MRGLKVWDNMRAFLKVLAGLLAVFYTNTLFALELANRAEGDSMKIAAFKVAFFLLLAFVLSLFLKKNKFSLSHNKSRYEDVELLACRIIRDSSSVSLVRVENKKILITTTKQGGVAMLNLEEPCLDLNPLREVKLREVSNA